MHKFDRLNRSLQTQYEVFIMQIRALDLDFLIFDLPFIPVVHFLARSFLQITHRTNDVEKLCINIKTFSGRSSKAHD